ncbi:MAG: leucine-rich repeat domain-containing protein, partial [Symploca sp. SIO2D2]|nr:leucine-rich repeat domain-containing protein [Symploca sp. SIO2D2]
IQPLSALTNLKELNLRVNRIKNLEPLSALTNLKKLNIESNKIKDIQPLSTLINLEVLNLSTNRIKDIKSLSALTNLQKLDLGYNQIKDLESLSALTNLKELILAYNRTRNLRPLDLKPLSALTNLEGLSLIDNQIKDIEPLSSLTNLKWLELKSNQIENIEPLSPLTNLTSLDLDFNGINDLEPLSTLTNLKWLNLRGNGIEIEDLEPLSALINLELLDLRLNPLRDPTCPIQSASACLVSPFEEPSLAESILEKVLLFIFSSLLSFGLLYYVGCIPWSLSWFSRKREAGVLLAYIGRTRQHKTMLWTGLIYLAIFVYLFLKFALWHVNFWFGLLFIWFCFFQFIWFVVIGLSKLEFREKGICFMYSLIKWYRINSYVWDGSQLNILKIRLKPLFGLFPDFKRIVIPKKHRDMVNNILEDKLPEKIAIPKT